MPLSDYFSPKQFTFTPDKAAAIGTGNEGQKFMSKSYDPTINNLQSIGPAYWDYVAHTLDKAGKPRTDYTGMLQDMLGRYGTVTADTKAPDWFLKGERYNYFNPQSPTAYFKSPQTMPATVQESSSSSSEATPQSMTDWAKMWQQNWAGKEGRPQWEEAMKLSYPTNANEWTKWVKESDWYKSQNPISGTASGNNISSGAISPAGNNIASGAVAPPNPGSAISGTQLSTTAPNTGTIGTDINQSPFSPTAGTRKRTSPNKYFNQRWFGTKQIA